MTADHHPRYVVRELRGWEILPYGMRGNCSSTFTMMDSWYGYAVVLQRQSGIARPPTKLRKQFQRAVDYMNTVRLCQWRDCDNEITRRPLDTGHRMRARYCSERCRLKAKYQRDRASGRK